MDSMILNGQKNTLAEYMILSGADNRLPMLDKDLYDSWKIRMDLCMQNREHRRMILESIEHSPLIWPTIEENGVTRTKKYAELSPTEKIQADCDMKAINIILQGLPTNIYSLVNHHRVAKDPWKNVQLLIQGTSLTKQERECKLLPPKWSKFVTDVKLVKDLHTNNFDQLHTYLEQHELNASEVRLMRERNSGLVVPVFKQRDDPIDAINKMMSFLSIVITSRFLSTNNRLRNSSNPRQQATIHDGRVTVQPLQEDKILIEGHMARQCPKPMRKRDATWIRDKVLLVKAQGNGKVINDKELEFLADPGIAEGPVTQSVITHNAAYQADDLDAYDSDCNDISIAKAVLMANLSSYGSYVLSEVPHSDNTNNDMLNQSVQEMSYSEPSKFLNHPENEIHSDSNIIPYSQYLLETQNAAVQDTNSSAQQDVMILSLFEQVSNQVTNCTKVNKDNLITNESLSVELERYKEFYFV
ncbi:hypothetical protein Tco_0825321 [Tanacetum coccineum]